MRPGKISPEEREKRLKEGRCFRCGNKGHFSYQCTPEDRQKGTPPRRINAVEQEGSGGVSLDITEQEKGKE